MKIIEVISAILVISRIKHADGRPLHAYDIPENLHARMHQALLHCPRQHIRSPQVAGLYVIWAAERIRRHYDGSGLSWDFINAPLPHIFDGQRVESFIRRGLEFWARPLRHGKSGNRLFMYSLLAEGGIPIAVLEGASQHAHVLRQMIDEIGNRGGIDLLGLDLAHDLARMRMRYLPQVLQNDDTITLFVELAQAVFELRRTIPPGLSVGQIEGWLNRERPNWQRELPIRLTPQVIDNIIRPSLTAVRKETRSNSHPAHREIHADMDGKLHAVVVLAQQASLPPGSLPATDAPALRLLPRFPTRRPFAYRALRTMDDPSWQLERIGGSGPEVAHLGLFEALEFDVMADSRNLGIWSALTSLPSPTELPTYWTSSGATGQPLRLKCIAAGRSRSDAIWVTIPHDAKLLPDDILEVMSRQSLVGSDIVGLRGKGVLHVNQQQLRIATTSETEAVAAELFPFGKTMPEWRMPSGDPVYVGEPQIFGQRADAPLAFVPTSQIRRSQRNSTTYGAEFHEWVFENETVAVARLVCLPASFTIALQEQGDGSLRTQISGLPPDLIVDLRAGSSQHHVQTTAAPLTLTLPPRAPDTAFVSLAITELATGKSLNLVATWPARLPQFLYKNAIVPNRDLFLSFDDLVALTAIAPGNRTRLTVSLPTGRSFELSLSGIVPMVRHTALLRKVLLQGSADNAITISMHNNAGQTGRIILRRYHGTMVMEADALKLGMPVDMPPSPFAEICQKRGHARLHLMNIATGETMEFATDVSEGAVNLRELSGIDAGLWLVQGQFEGRQQRPLAWFAGQMEGTGQARPSRRSERITAYRKDFIQIATSGSSDGYWRSLLRQLLAARDGGDPAMLDQFHALEVAPQAIARMLFSLSEPELMQFFGLDDYWDLFWPGLPVHPLIDAAKDISEATSSALLLGGFTPSAASETSAKMLIDRLAFLRVQRPELAGQIAVVLLETGLIGHVATDRRFEGLFIANPQRAVDGPEGAIQMIAKSDPNLPRGVLAVPPVELVAPRNSFQKTVEMMICAVFSVAEQALGLRPGLSPQQLLDAMLIEIASPELFSRALQPAMLIAYQKSKSLK